MITNKQFRFDYVNIIGGGLAGCEAALFLANNGIKVNLFEMKPNYKSPAHKSDMLAELVCSNSLKSMDELTASGLLKKELAELDCHLLKIALECKVPAGSALAVDREMFSKRITDIIKNHRNINLNNQKITTLNLSEPTIIATGPLTDDEFFENLKSVVGSQNCYFYDAIAPIVYTSSIDMTKAFWGNRYGKGSEEGDYLNCPLNKEEYTVFYNELINAQTAPLKDFEKQKVFEGCMPIEVMAKRGFEALRFGPMKPVGLFDTNKEERPYAVVQLRKEDEAGTLVNLVGFQTNLTYGEQKRVFSLIPALKNAEFVRYGQMHRNSYINAPVCLNEFSQLKKYPNIFIAGQLSGVEGYMESIASGLYSAINMFRYLKFKKCISLPSTTVLGAMINYISKTITNSFQPMNANFGIVECSFDIKDKKEKRQKMVETSIAEIKKFKEKIYEWI